MSNSFKTSYSSGADARRDKCAESGNRYSTAKNLAHRDLLTPRLRSLWGHVAVLRREMGLSTGVEAAFVKEEPAFLRASVFVAFGNPAPHNEQRLPL